MTKTRWCDPSQDYKKTHKSQKKKIVRTPVKFRFHGVRRILPPFRFTVCHRFLSLFFPLRGITGRFGSFLSYRSSDHRAQFVVILCPPRIFYFLSCRRFGCNSSERPVIPRNPSSNARYMFVLANLWQATLRVSQEYELATATPRGRQPGLPSSRILIIRRAKEQEINKGLAVIKA